MIEDYTSLVKLSDVDEYNQEFNVNLATVYLSFHKRSFSIMKIINTTRLPEALGPYSRATVVNGMVYTSGQIP